MAGVSSSCRQLNFEDSNEVGRSVGEDELIAVMSLNSNQDLQATGSFASKELIPKIGMEFETEEHAYQFYLAYAKEVGFGIRRSRNHKDKSGNFIDRLFCCSAEGKREKDKRHMYVKAACPETRFGCEAKMRVSRRKGRQLCVVQFIEEHNHYLSSPNKTHLHRSHRKISLPVAMQIEMANDVGIPSKASYDVMVRQVGGRENLGFIPDDYRNYLRSKRTRDAKRGDTGGVLEYLHKMQLNDPNFFYAIQVDEDDLITNIFWSDAKMRADYSKFGDVVCFDTTYRKNNEGRPLALLVGVNHHKQTTFFGVALLYDETSLTFEWLFDTFAKATCDKKPKTILTDQDAAMAKALVLRWPKTHHRLCIWHIYQNAAIHLSGVFSRFKDFARDFSSCIYDFEEEEDFVNAWNEMLCKYELEDNDWLRRMFGIKEKWALVYGRQMFCADMTTTQRSESINSVVKRYITYQHKFLEFFHHFERLLEDHRYEELKADFKSSISIPSLLYPIETLKHAVSVYTPEVFNWFQNEWCKSHNCCIESSGEDGSIRKYQITPNKKSYYHTVTYDLSNGNVDCSCRKFEFAGILCSHVLKVFTVKNIIDIPSQYILKRWTRKAKLGFVGDENSGINISNLDPKICQSMRYKELCGLYVQLVTKASESEETYKIVKDCILKMLEIVDARLQSNGSTVQQPMLSSNVRLQDEEMVQYSSIKGIKIKKKSVSSKRLRGGLEKAMKKRKATKKVQTQANLTIAAPTLPFNLEVISANSSQTKFIEGVPLSMDMTYSQLAQQPHGGSDVMINNSRQNSNVNYDSADIGGFVETCDCLASCAGSIFCKYKVKRK